MDNSFKNADYKKFNEALMKILEHKYNIKINSKVVKKEETNG